MNYDAIMLQIVAMGAQLEALKATVEAERDAEPIHQEGCQHHDVEQIGTFGHPELRCRACGALIPEPVEAA